MDKFIFINACVCSHSHGANPTIKNKENLTPCELANKLGHKQLMLLFASQLGSSMLIRLHQQTAN